MHGHGQLLERDEPRARLEAALSAARRGRGRVVSLEGEAGIGKTALTLAFVEDHQRDARVHLGGCENLATAEPMGPLRDIARESQGRFSVSATGPLATYDALLRLLTSGRGPALLVLEDIHWADDATLDLLRFLGRRIRAAGVMALVTFRNDEPDSQGRLAALWSDMPRDARERIELEPLSLDAVGELASGRGRRAGEVYAMTRGNPFHVTEFLAGAGEGAPRGVQEVTVARAARLSPQARRTLECASIFPRRIDEASLRLIAEDADHAGVEACLAAGMLEARDGALAFRHELARRAIAEAMSPLRRRELHAAALALLKGRNDARAAEVAHHAAEAGAHADLLAYSIRAAQEAAALGAYRQTMAHLSQAIAHSSELPEADRGQLLERKAFAAHFCGAFEESLQALRDAIALYRRTGNDLGVGNVLRMSAHVYWNLGDSALAETRAEEAVKVLEAHAGSGQYTMALASLVQFDTLADRHEAAIAAAGKSLALARRLGRADIATQALTYLRSAEASTNLAEGAPAIRSTIEEARRRGDLDALPRLYAYLTSTTAAARRHEGLLQACEEGVAVCASRDQAPLEAMIRGNRATALLDMGRLDEAVAEAEEVVHGPYPKGVAATLPATIALSRARVRLGLAEGGLLEQAKGLPTSRRDIIRRAPIAIAEAEAHWLDGSHAGAAERLAETLGEVLRNWAQLWHIGEMALWLAILGKPPALDARAIAEVPPPHLAHIEGRWREAAHLWAEMGCPYEQAIALSQGEEAAQREALAIFDGLGASPAAQRLRRLMRAGGMRSVPSGPRAARRSNPAGLTGRQMQVLGLLGEGLANADIADRLGLSAKTVEHHVTAILAALEAPSRLAAVRIARERGLHGPGAA